MWKKIQTPLGEFSERALVTYFLEMSQEVEFKSGKKLLTLSQELQKEGKTSVEDKSENKDENVNKSNKDEEPEFLPEQEDPFAPEIVSETFYLIVGSFLSI